MYEYELFKMKPHESFTEMTNRLNTLLTTLKKFGKYFLHLQLLPSDYFETNQPRPIKVWDQKNV